MEKVDRRRSEELRVKLSRPMLAEFVAIADSRGLLPATLAAAALGEFVERHRRDSSMARMVALDISKRMSDGAVSGGALEQVLERSLAGLLAGPGGLLACGSVSSAAPEAAADTPPSGGVAGAAGVEDRARSAT